MKVLSSAKNCLTLNKSLCFFALDNVRLNIFMKCENIKSNS